MVWVLIAALIYFGLFILIPMVFWVIVYLLLRPLDEEDYRYDYEPEDTLLYKIVRVLFIAILAWAAFCSPA